MRLRERERKRWEGIFGMWVGEWYNAVQCAKIKEVLHFGLYIIDFFLHYAIGPYD